MIRLELSNQECTQILAILAKVAWEISNPLIMKIGAQMEAQARAAVPGAGAGQGILRDHGDQAGSGALRPGNSSSMWPPPPEDLS